MYGLLQPVYSLDLVSLRRAGRFASPEGDDGKGAEGDKGTDPPADKKAEPGKGEEKGKDDPVSRISTLVDERNAARQEAETHKSTAERLQQEIEQLKAGDQTQVVKDLQAKLNQAQEATKTRFDKLLEIELNALPEAAQKAVKAIPGGSEAQFDWLIANRALFTESKGIDGPKNDKKPPKGDEPGASSAAKGYVESRKAPKAGFPGLTG
jgi:hypothetical protein